jgi:hypothetical protein
MIQNMWPRRGVVKGGAAGLHSVQTPEGIMQQERRAMTRIAVIVALTFGIAAAAAQAQQQGAGFGCLGNGNCGQKGNTPSAGPRDYWQNWICQGCHVGPPVAYVLSPPERALMNVPARFWSMHADAMRDGETRARISQHRLLPASRMPPAFQNLMVQRPPPPAPAR